MRDWSVILRELTNYLTEQYNNAYSATEGMEESPYFYEYAQGYRDCAKNALEKLEKIYEIDSLRERKYNECKDRTDWSRLRQSYINIIDELANGGW